MNRRLFLVDLENSDLGNQVKEALKTSERHREQQTECLEETDKLRRDTFSMINLVGRRGLGARLQEPDRPSHLHL